MTVDQLIQEELSAELLPEPAARPIGVPVTAF